MDEKRTYVSSNLNFVPALIFSSDAHTYKIFENLN